MQDTRAASSLYPACTRLYWTLSLIWSPRAAIDIIAKRCKDDLISIARANLDHLDCTLDFNKKAAMPSPNYRVSLHNKRSNFTGVLDLSYVLFMPSTKLLFRSNTPKPNRFGRGSACFTVWLTRCLHFLGHA